MIAPRQMTARAKSMDRPTPRVTFWSDRGESMTTSASKASAGAEPDGDPVETAEWLEFDRRRRPLSRARARPVPGAEAGIAAARPGRLGAPAALFGLSQHDPAREAGPPIPATSRSRSASPRSCAGTRSPWWCAPTAPTASSAAISRAMRPPRRSSRPASTISSAPRARASAAISSISSRIRRPASTRAPSSKGASARSDLARYRQEVGGGGLSSYPHPWLMPDFWQFPTGSMGIGVDQRHLSGPLHALSREPRPDGRRATAGSGASTATASSTSRRRPRR